MTVTAERPPSRGTAGTAWNDPKVPGLRLRHFDRKSVWYLYYRTKTRQQRNMKLGDAGLYTLTAVRERARDILVDVAAGRDPAREIKAVAERPTVKDLAAFHVERHVKVKLKGAPADKERKGRLAERAWEANVYPVIKPTTAVADVTEAMISELHHKMRRTPILANRIMAMLSKAFNLAEPSWRPRNSNPVQVERYPETKRRRYPVKDEPLRLAKALEDYRSENPLLVSFFELIAHTGVRAGEIRTARRAWVRDNALHLPDSKTGEKVVPLSTHAIAIIETLPVMKANPFLFPGLKPKQPLVNYAKPWAKVLDKAGITNLRVHDMRRFFASAGLSRGQSLSAIGSVLGHTQASTTMRYAFLMTDDARATAEVASRRVNELMTPVAPVGESAA